jgi:CRP-like cAMP-binding protein
LTLSETDTTQPNQNHLLAGLPNEAWGRLSPELENIPLKRGQLLTDSTTQLDRFYFVTSSVVSFLYNTADGHTAELALVGPEGGIGLHLVLGGQAPPADIVVQVAGDAWMLPQRPLRLEFKRGGALQRNLLRFSQALMIQMAQTAVCNRHHTVQQQLIRWILLSLDRLKGNELPMTHESIAHMLGVRRAGVSEAARRLLEQGVIEYSRSVVCVPDRTALEDQACECYRAVKAEHARLLADLETQGRSS